MIRAVFDKQMVGSEHQWGTFCTLVPKNFHFPSFVMQIITAFIHFKFTNDVPIVFVLQKTVSLEVLSEFLSTRPTENEAWSVFFLKKDGLGWAVCHGIPSVSPMF